MSKNLTRFRNIAWTLTIVYWITLLVLTHLPPDKVPDTRISDKTEHLLAYGLLAGAVHVSLWPRRWPAWKLAIAVLCICMAYGAFDELTQPYFGRTCDIYDWLADSSGALTAVIAGSIAYRFLGARFAEAPAMSLESTRD